MQLEVLSCELNKEPRPANTPELSISNIQYGPIRERTA